MRSAPGHPWGAFSHVSSSPLFAADLRRQATETIDPDRLWAIANAAESQARNDRYDFGDYIEDVYVCEGVAEYAAERASIRQTPHFDDK